MTGLSFYTAPSHVKGAHSSAIIGVGRWFTDGHVEEGGDISVSLTHIGRKLFMIAKGGAASSRLFAMTSTIESFVSWVLKGAILPCEKNVFYHITDVFDMIIQPSLCAHSVLTISTGSFLVSGWEANDVTDRHLKSQLVTKYCPGICNEVLRVGLKKSNPQKCSEALATAKNSKTEAIGQLVSMSNRKFSKKSPSNRGRPSVSKKQRKLNNLKDVRMQFQERQQQRKG